MLIVDVIDDYQAGHSSLRQVNSQLEGLIQALEGIGDDLRHAFLERWAVLEEIVATKSEAINGDLSIQETQNIEIVLAEIRDAAQRRAES